MSKRGSYIASFFSFSPQNLIAQSQSGTGKTAAFVLAMLTRVDASKPYPQVKVSHLNFSDYFPHSDSLPLSYI